MIKRGGRGPFHQARTSGGAGDGPAPAAFLLIEGGTDKLLLEGGTDKLLLEGSY